MPRRTLLVVEDDVAMARVFDLVASTSGWAVRRVNSYREARDLLAGAAFRCDAAVVDLKLPDGWGLDLVGSLHAPPILCAGLVVVTGLARNPALAADVYARGAACLLWKPTTAQAIVRALEVAHARTGELRRVAHAESRVTAVDEQATEDLLFERTADRFLLDEREILIVRRLCAEKTDREIAAELAISESALKRAQSVIRSKMNVETRSGVVRKVYQSSQPFVRSGGGGAAGQPG